MTDYFALLDQPRRPWIDLDELKRSYHQKTLQFHPDAQILRGLTNPAGADFSNLNEAYQVLRDPKRRLHHLLSLEGIPPSHHETIPNQLQELFPQVSTFSHRSKGFLEKLGATSNKLTRSLLTVEALQLQKEGKGIRQQVQNLFDASLREVHEIDKIWKENWPAHLKTLSSLHATFAYLTRWLSQLDEMIFQVSSQ